MSIVILISVYVFYSYGMAWMRFANFDQMAVALYVATDSAGT